ncbi:hypothetical protein INH39_22595 [Massilia violaceinigra]|uniref:Uncharacterized protein n=1 Tax=Massilia violaceinigra TaxID=2045208 RepID=A0ABY4A0F4_9BURK|nr:hypothetical protein [Massilia violaceinigra]UOD28233.1 hypothetical protein INH39_22595 [Massilia violaceinigra]
MTYGLDIFARSMTISTRGAGKGFAHGNVWQYHPRSDRHSKILCWAIFFDLLLRTNLISKHVREEKISFGINHKMRDFTHDREKDLDLVICRRTQETRTVAGAANFRDLVGAYTIALSKRECDLLNGLPTIPLTGVQSALVALEAKAAMTEFGKARPRIYDELNSSHLTIHGDTDSAIAAGFAIVNFAGTFVSPTRNVWKVEQGAPTTLVNVHRQPKDAMNMIEKIKQLPRRSAPGTNGFDAFGLMLINCTNDGSPVNVVNSSPAPRPGDAFYYDNFIERIETIYASRFAEI